MRGHVHFDGWAGRTKHPVEVLGECRRRGKEHYRVRLLESAYRHAAGKVLYPPKGAVTLDVAPACETCHGNGGPSAGDLDSDGCSCRSCGA